MSTKTNITNSDQSAVSSNEDSGTLSKYSDYQRSSASFNSSEKSRDTNNRNGGSSGIGTSISSSSARGSTTLSSSSHHHPNAQLAQVAKAQKLFVKRVELLDELKSLLNLQHSGSNAPNTQGRPFFLYFKTFETVWLVSIDKIRLYSLKLDLSSFVSFLFYSFIQYWLNEDNIDC